MPYDLVIRGGVVVDGSGLPRYRADVGIEGDTIAAVGRIDERGRQEIDAEGHAVTPGFVDGHTHMDAQVFWDPLGSCSCYHGVTSVVMGNCGFSLAPAPESQRALVVRNLERAEDISAAAMAEGIPWTWDGFRGYLDAVEGLPKAINYAAYIGHSALRTYAMGEKAFEQAAGADDLAAMERELRDALDAGAIGLSTSRTVNHLTSDDRPVASRLAEWSEVCRLVGAMGELGVGVLEVALDPEFFSPDPETRGQALGRLRHLAVQTRVPVTFGVLGARDERLWQDQLDNLDRTAAEGGRMFAQTHCRGVSLLLSFVTKLPFDRLPEWRDFRALPLEEQAHLLRQTEVRQRLVQAANEGSYAHAVGADARRPRYDRIHVLERAFGTNPTVEELATASGRNPVDVMIDRALESDFQQFFQQFPVKPEAPAIETMMRHPRTVMTFSDSGAHVSQIMDSSIQTDLLADWVRNREVFTLEEAIRMISYVPASLWGLTDRGLVREGMKADLNVIDADTVAPELPRLVGDLPAGARRLLQKSRGIKATVVSGQPTLLDGEPTGCLPGRLLRGPLHRRQAASRLA
jgi:N-acyl-D-aspartate/D-glutamate deacylase